MEARWSVICVLAACGRVGFDPLALTTGDAAPADVAVDARVLPSGLKLWLEMETDPANAVDSAGGHAIACTLTGKCPVATTGKHGHGYSFAKTANALSLTVTYRADLDPSGGYTTAAWARLEYFSDYLCMFGEPYVSGSNPDWDTYVMCVDGLGASTCGSNAVYWNTDPYGQQCGPVIASGAWHHVAMTWDGTTKKSYLDGAEVGSVAVGALGFDASDLHVGGDQDGSLTPAFFWSGALDDVMWFDRPLSAAEISQLASP